MSAAIRRWSAGALIVALVVFARGESSPSVDRAALVRDALAAYDHGVSLARSQPEASAQSFEHAIRAFQALRESGLRSAALEFNLGNAHYRAGDLGRAVLSYLRAQRIRPADSDLAANLEYVRRQVRPQIAAPTTTMLLDRLADWSARASVESRFWFSAVCATCGWGVLVVLALARRSAAGLRATCAAVIAVGLVAATSAGWELRRDALTPVAVVVAGDQTLRTGRGAAYEAVLTEPLGPGVELRVLERRGGWSHVRLASGGVGWLPDEAIEMR